MPKAFLYSCCPKAAILQICFPKRLPKTSLQRGPRKLRPKLLSLPRKLFPKAASKSCFLKLLPKAAISQAGFFQAQSPLVYGGNALTLHVASRFPKGKLILVQCSQFNILSFALYFCCSPPKAVPQSCSRSFSPKLCPKDLLQSFFPKPASLHQKRLPKAILHSGARKPRLKVATRSCCPKLLPQTCNLSNLYTKMAPQSYSAKRLPKAAPESCY